VYRLTEEHQPVEAAFHLLARWLVVLDSVSGAQTDAAADDRFATLVAAFELKLLHSLGLAPQLASCVRCGAVDMLTGFSGADGGIICASCMQTPDVHISAEVYGAAVHLMQAALADTAREQFSALDIRSVRELIVAPTCLTHAGVRLGSRG
jgi:DNA repair protein RecO (recombination protein O)